jgi:hypothetical protein
VGGDVGPDAHPVDQTDPGAEGQAAAEEEGALAGPAPQRLHPARTRWAGVCDGSA